MLKMAISISETSKLNSTLLMIELTFAGRIFPLLPGVGKPLSSETNRVRLPMRNF